MLPVLHPASPGKHLHDRHCPPRFHAWWLSVQLGWWKRRYPDGQQPPALPPIHPGCVQQGQYYSHRSVDAFGSFALRHTDHLPAPGCCSLHNFPQIVPSRVCWPAERQHHGRGTHPGCKFQQIPSHNSDKANRPNLVRRRPPVLHQRRHWGWTDRLPVAGLHSLQKRTLSPHPGYWHTVPTQHWVWSGSDNGHPEWILRQMAHRLPTPDPEQWLSLVFSFASTLYLN